MKSGGEKPPAFTKRLLWQIGRFLPAAVTTGEVKCVEIPGWQSSLMRSGLSPVRLDSQLMTYCGAPSRDARNDPDVFSLARYSACIVAECQLSDLNKDDPAIQTAIDQQSTKVAIRLKQTQQFFQTHQPKLALLSQGYLSDSAIIRRVAIRRGVPLVSVENTAIADRFLWDCVSGITTNLNVSKNYFWRYQDCLDHDEVDCWATSLIERTRALKNDEHQSPGKPFDAPGRRPFILFLGQVFTDSAVLFGLGRWHSPQALISTVIEQAKKHGLDVVIKLHPKEQMGCDPVQNKPYSKLTLRKLQANEVTSQQLQEPFVHVDTENQFDTFDLMKRAKVAVTLTSQTGLEASIRGLPTVVAGNAFYNGLGFTFDAANPSELSSAIEEALREPSPSSKTKLARAFAYVHFQKYCRPKTAKALRNLIRHAKSETIAMA